MLCRTIDTHRDPSEIVEFVSDSHLNMIISHGVLLQLKDVTLDPMRIPPDLPLEGTQCHTKFRPPSISCSS